MLRIANLTHYVGGHLLFDHAVLAVPQGQKVGLIGANGSGKSTLLALIAGEGSCDGGTVRVRKGIRIGSVAQEAPYGQGSLLDTVLESDTERTRLLAESETERNADRIAEGQQRLIDIEAHTAPMRAAAILAGLGFDEEAQGRPCAELSGGLRMRVGLAAALFARPHLLLLDEPTNHLDLEATMWLESFLAKWADTLLVVSHERSLLNRVPDVIVHLEGGKLVRYGGNYDSFEKTRGQRLALASRTRKRQLEERRRIQAFVDRFRYKATKARQAQSRLKALERMEPVAAAIEDKITAFEFRQPDPLPPPLIALEDTAVGYGTRRPVLSEMGLRIDMDDRIALLGANGNGKSTLIKLLAGRLAPRSGKVVRHGKLRVGYFAQHQVDELDLDATAFDHAARVMAERTQAQVRGYLGRFGFARDKADVRSRDLSGGEKARLLMALMCVEAPHLMLLDEPTNHLDVQARAALVQALNEYAGAVILVSHDAHLIEHVCDRLWLVADGTCRPFDGNLEDYRGLLLEERRRDRRQPRARSGNGRREGRRERAAARQRMAPLRRAAREAEERLETLQGDKDRLLAKLGRRETYEASAEDQARLRIDLARVEARLSEAEETWFATHRAVDKAG